LLRILKDFNELIMRGKVADLAVGFIIGAAFSTKKEGKR
jgi:large-conductance mechanosensitive channel